MRFRFHPIFASLAIVSASVPAIARTSDRAVAPSPAASPAISLEQRTLLRCAAAFALVAHDQATNGVAASHWPDMRQRGREFFVRASAQLMDRDGLSRDRIAALMADAARDLRSKGTLDQVMPPCLLTLEASGL